MHIKYILPVVMALGLLNACSTFEGPQSYQRGNTRYVESQNIQWDYVGEQQQEFADEI